MLLPLKDILFHTFSVTVLHIIGMRNKFSKAVAYTTASMINRRLEIREPAKKNVSIYIFLKDIII